MHYHVSLDFRNTFNILEPKMPRCVQFSLKTNSPVLEEKNTPRICVSNNLGKCFDALGDIEDYFFIQKSDPVINYEAGYMDAYTGKWGFPVRIYTITEIPSVSNEEIIHNNWVFDAASTGECWFTAPTNYEDNYLFLITDFSLNKKTKEINYKGLFIDKLERIVQAQSFDIFREYLAKEDLEKPKEEILKMFLDDCNFPQKNSSENSFEEKELLEIF